MPDDHTPLPPDTAGCGESVSRGDASAAAVSAGQKLARGVCRALAAEHDFATAVEVTLATGQRVDVMAIGLKGEIWVVECKSSRADFTSDAKWHGYLDWADRFFWAVGPDFPTELLPEGTGLILSDGFGAEIIRIGPETKLAGARRKAVTLRFARHTARRAQAARDPDAQFGWG
ncbi:MAG: MmcB family DNA repair protein [Pseudomonadota bacterium]